MAQPQRKLPSDRTIAFAAAIVSSKPADLTVREYIALLTRHVAKGRRENSLSAAYRHLDRSAYWRAECERAKEDCRAAEEARIEALREVDGLKVKLEAAKATPGTSSKRKRANADVVPYSREVKKGSKEKEEKREVFLGGIVIEEVVVGEGGVGGQSLMRRLYQIGMCFKPGAHFDPKVLAHHLCSAAADVARVVLDALEQQDTTSGSDLSTTMTAGGRIVAAILAGLQKLLRMEEAGATRGQVTYALVGMYEKLLGGFDAVSRGEADTDASNDSATDPNSSSTKQRLKTRGGPPRVNIRDVPALNVLAGLLSGIVKQLDPKQDSHREIFEGFLFCVLSKLGNRIYTATFSNPRPETIEEEIATHSSQDRSDPESNPGTKSIPVRQAHLEAPYLLHLLKQSIALTPSFLNPAASTGRGSKSKPTSKPGSVTKASLSLAARERLQATLVHAIFGPEGVQEDSDLFLNSLQMRETSGASVSLPRVKEAEVGEWFQGEVWRLLGWEVLGREVDMPVCG